MDLSTKLRNSSFQTTTWSKKDSSTKTKRKKEKKKNCDQMGKKGLWKTWHIYLQELTPKSYKSWCCQRPLVQNKRKRYWLNQGSYLKLIPWWALHYMQHFVIIKQSHFKIVATSQVIALHCTFLGWWSNCKWISM